VKLSMCGFFVIVSCIWHLVNTSQPIVLYSISMINFSEISNPPCGKEDRICFGSSEGHLYGLGYPRQPFPPSYPVRGNFSFCLCKIQTTVYMNVPELSRRELGWTSCLTSAGRVTLAGGTTFLHVNTLARLTGTTLGEASVTKCLD